jgi:hypothetical protein
VGLFDKLRSATGGVSKDLMEHGILARGEVTNVQMTGMSVSHGGGAATENQVCNVTVNVLMDNTPPFSATVRQGIPMLVIAQLSSPGTVVAVRVDPENHEHIAIDFDNAPPTVTLSATGPNRGSAAEMLATGTAARAVIIESAPLGVRSQAGLDMYAFVVTILCDGHAPYQTKMGNAVPPGGVPLIYPGANLPAKVKPEEEGQVAIDWEAAIAEMTHVPSATAPPATPPQPSA